MTKRQVRRAEERRARKAVNIPQLIPLQASTESSFETKMENPAAARKPLFTEAKLEANRANAQRSTGPATTEGKSISARNNFRHGFAGTFTVLPEEDADAFEQLHFDLQLEQGPQNTTEELLVAGMAQHQWLVQRALRLQEALLASRDLDDPATQKQLALYMRYQTTNQRAFHKCLADLLKLRKERQTEQRGFESQKRNEAREQRAERTTELHNMLVECRIGTEQTRKLNLEYERARAEEQAAA